MASIRQLCGTGVILLCLAGAKPALAQSNLDNAVATAGQWASLADAALSERMWSSSSPIMQSKVTKEAWSQYLGRVQKEAGRAQNRLWSQMIRVTDPPGLPPGDYVNVIFLTRFSQQPAAETISLIQSGNGWLPVGYVVSQLNKPAAQPVASK